MSLYYDENSESQVSSTTGNACVLISEPVNTMMYSSFIEQPSSSQPREVECRVVLGERNDLKLETSGHNAAILVRKAVNRGRWSKEEDLKLKELVKKYGEKWTEVAAHFSDRNDLQCQQRWSKVLDPRLVKGPWTYQVSRFILRNKV